MAQSISFPKFYILLIFCTSTICNPIGLIPDSNEILMPNDDQQKSQLPEMSTATFTRRVLELENQPKEIKLNSVDSVKNLKNLKSAIELGRSLGFPFSLWTNNDCSYPHNGIWCGDTGTKFSSHQLDFGTDTWDVSVLQLGIWGWFRRLLRYMIQKPALFLNYNGYPPYNNHHHGNFGHRPGHHHLYGGVGNHYAGAGIYGR